MNVALALLWKDLVTEWRSRDRIVAMTVFSFLVIVVFQFAWPRLEPEEMARLAPGVLWVTYVFAAVIGLGRTFATELENEAVTALALAPGNRGWIFVGKAAATWVLIAFVQALSGVVFLALLARRSADGTRRYDRCRRARRRRDLQRGDPALGDERAQPLP